MNDNFISAKHKISDFGFKTGSFTPEGEKNPIDYTQIVVRAVIDGDVEEFVLSGQNPIKPKLLKTMLKAADESKQGDFLGDANK